MGSKADRQEEFDTAFLDVIDNCLRQVFGEKTSQAILLHFERNKGLKREEIPCRIEEFNSGLAELMERGAPVLERMFIKFLCSKLQLEYESNPELTFTDHVQKLRKRFEG